MTRAEHSLEEVRLMMAASGTLGVAVWKITGRSQYGPEELTTYVLTADNAVLPDLRDICLVSYLRVDRLERLGIACLAGAYEVPRRDPL